MSLFNGYYQRAGRGAVVSQSLLHSRLVLGIDAAGEHIGYQDIGCNIPVAAKLQDYIYAAVEVFQPLSPPVERLTRGLKAAFDPAGILNPGRMYANL
jgi:hypothetical protein